MASLADEHLLRRGEALARTFERWADRLEARDRALWAGLHEGQRFNTTTPYTVAEVTPEGALIRFDDGTERWVRNPYA